MWAGELWANSEMTPHVQRALFLLMWTTCEVQLGCMFTLMKSVRVLYMWAPLGRKKQLPGLTSLKKNSSWSCRKTEKHDIYSWYLFLFTDFVFLSYRSDAAVVSPPRLLLLPLPFLLVLLSWEGHTLETRQAPGLRLIGLGDWWQLRCSRYGAVAGRETIMSQQQTGLVRLSRKGGVPARLMGATVFLRQENRKLASDKHNILLLIFPAWLPWNPTLPSNSPIWKLLPPSGSIKMRQIPFSHYVSRRTDVPNMSKSNKSHDPWTKIWLRRRTFAPGGKQSGKEEHMDTEDKGISKR